MQEGAELRLAGCIPGPRKFVMLQLKAAPPTPPCTAPQAFDSMNKALKLSCTKGLPVRVVRSFKASAQQRPAQHNRGLASFAVAVCVRTPAFTALLQEPSSTCLPPAPAGEALCIRPHPGDPRALRRHLPHRKVLAHKGQAGAMTAAQHAGQRRQAGVAGPGVRPATDSALARMCGTRCQVSAGQRTTPLRRWLCSLACSQHITR
jgi:hypothetical protein